MALFSRLPALPRATGTTPGPVKPSSWNELVTAVETLDKRIVSLFPISSPDLAAKVSTAGFSFTFKRRMAPNGSLYEFQVSAIPTLFKASAGYVQSTYIDDTALLWKVDPADGDWYFAAKVVINATTGAVESETVEWIYNVSPVDTSTDFYKVIAMITLEGGVITDSSQYTYGPMIYQVGGGVEDTWSVIIL